ncbi:MAG: DEAD/DEAH box helicase [Bdellovibrionaceae bacterium]|nr:DEAD/DEAH box helicase [Pseudobdellovibrionaceae bacterium]
MDRGQAVLELRPNDANGTYIGFDHFLLHLPSGRLYFWNWSTEAKLLSMLDDASSRTDMDSHTVKGWPFTLRLSVQEHAMIEIVHTYMEEEAASRIPFSVAPKTTNLDADKIQPRVYVSPDGDVRIAKAVAGPVPFGSSPNATPSSLVWNFSPFARGWIWSLLYGLPAYFDVDPKGIAAQRRGPKRDFDLRALRHLGLASLLFWEGSSAALDGHLSDGTTIAKPEEVTVKLAPKILALLGVASEDSESEITDSASPPPHARRASRKAKSSKPHPLYAYGSARMIELLDKYVSKIFEFASPQVDHGGQFHVYTAEGAWTLNGIHRPELQLLNRIVEGIALRTNGDCFRKARSNSFKEIFSDFVDHPENELPLLTGSTPSSQLLASIARMPLAAILGSPEERLRFLTSLAADGTAIFFDGKPLVHLQDGEFETKLDLSETDTSADLRNIAELDRLANQPIDWFELHPRFFLKGEEISPAQAKRVAHDGVIEHKGVLYLIPGRQLPSLKRLDKFWIRLQKSQGGTKGLGGGADSKDARWLQVPRSQVLEMLALRASGIPVLGGPRWQKICAFYDSLNQPRAELQIPESVHAQLLPYQVTGVRWLMDLDELGLGAILADDMGLGKTLQTLTFLAIRQSSNRLGHVLIVVPTSLTYNWRSESERFTPNLCWTTLSASRDVERITKFLEQNRQGIVLTTYGMLAEQSEFLAQRPWDIAIFDEAQNIKNIAAKRTTAARSLQARYKICLTGTPLENHMGELYSILDLCVPGCVGDLSEFRKRYITPATILAEDLAELKLTCKPLIMRRTKTEILKQLPPKREDKVIVAFTARQQKIYRDVAISYNEKIRQAIAEQGEAKSQLQMLTALLRLRQACSDPAALPGTTFSETPPKLETLLESLHEIVESGESALVFTQFLSTYQRVETELKRAGIPCYGIHGGLSRARREDELNQFQAHGPGGAVMLMTLKTGGVGLNLTKASYVFHIEPWWNPAVENQATDRAHRIGQERPVQVFRYIMHESVEEKIELLKERKEKRFSAMFAASDVESESQLQIKSGLLTQNDFEYLLGQGPNRGPTPDRD